MAMISGSLAGLAYTRNYLSFLNIVADSDPEKEYQETVNKARATMKAIEAAEKGIS